LGPKEEHEKQLEEKDFDENFRNNNKLRKGHRDIYGNIRIRLTNIG